MEWTYFCDHRFPCVDETKHTEACVCGCTISINDIVVVLSKLYLSTGKCAMAYLTYLNLREVSDVVQNIKYSLL